MNPLQGSIKREVKGFLQSYCETGKLVLSPVAKEHTGSH